VSSNNGVVVVEVGVFRGPGARGTYFLKVAPASHDEEVRLP
jgi:hypothetical protein